MQPKQQSFSYVTAAIAVLKDGEIHLAITNTVTSLLDLGKYSESMMHSQLEGFLGL